MTTPSSSPDVLIVGGGIIGLLTAHELAGSGVKVSVVDRQAIGRESSWAGGGILSPLNFWQVPASITALCRWSQQVYPTLTANLLATTSVDPEWIKSGLLIRGCPELEQAKGWCALHGINHAVLMPSEVACREPALAPSDTPSLWLPDIAQIRNPRMIQALRVELERLGVRLLENRPVTALVAEQGRIRQIKTGDGTLTADVYVIAAGAWSGLIGPDVETMLDIQPVKGQMLLFRADPDLLKAIVLQGDRYLIPRRDGHILAGSTVEHTEFAKSVTEQARTSLSDFAYRVLPALKECSIEKQWAGLRPGSPTGIPRIARHPKISNLYFNCGHFRNGFVMAPASARLLADLILGRPPIVAPEPYSIPVAQGNAGDTRRD